MLHSVRRFCSGCREFVIHAALEGLWIFSGNIFLRIIGVTWNISWRDEGMCWIDINTIFFQLQFKSHKKYKMKHSAKVTPFAEDWRPGTINLIQFAIYFPCGPSWQNCCLAMTELILTLLSNSTRGIVKKCVVNANIMTVFASCSSMIMVM